MNVDANGSAHDRKGLFSGLFKREVDTEVLPVSPPATAGPPGRIEPGTRVEVYSRPYNIRATGTLIFTEVYEGRYMLGTLVSDSDGERFRTEGFWTRVD